MSQGRYRELREREIIPERAWPFLRRLPSSLYPFPSGSEPNNPVLLGLRLTSRPAAAGANLAGVRGVPPFLHHGCLPRACDHWFVPEGRHPGQYLRHTGGHVW